jgi:flagellar M-ring protein FliF
VERRVNGLVNMVRGLGPLRLAAMAGVTIAMLGFFLFLSMRLTAPPMSLLYSGLDMNDSGRIVAKLEQMNIPFRLEADGGSILVPNDQALRLRVTMAEDGLPSGGSIGYEIFDKSDALGTTSFVQNINHLRALEGELARTIRSIDRVQSARVHLVLPQREVFSRESRDASAAIVIKTKGGRLDDGQVQAIQHLAAASVPGLKPSRVSIVDDRGNLLGGSMNDPNAAEQLTSNLDQKTANYEARVRRELEELLGNSIGFDKVRAEVAAELDFDRITTNSEEFDPDKQVVRSTQSVSEKSANSEGSQRTTVSVGNNLPEAQGQNGTNNSSNSERNEETINYEISKTTRTQIHEAGRVKRVSVAVLVDGNYTVGADGTRTYQPRSQQELDQIATLVKSAIGFDEKRGDKVDVVNMAFSQVDASGGSAGEAAAAFLGLEKSDYMKIAETLVLGVVGILVVLLVLRPLVTRIMAGGFPGAPMPAGAMAGAGGQAIALSGPAAPGMPGGQRQLAAPSPGDGQTGSAIAAREEVDTELESMIDIANIEGRVKASSLKKVGEIIDKHPEEAIAIMRNWMYKEA